MYFEILLGWCRTLILKQRIADTPKIYFINARIIESVPYKQLIRYYLKNIDEKNVLFKSIFLPAAGENPPRVKFKKYQKKGTVPKICILFFLGTIRPDAKREINCTRPYTSLTTGQGNTPNHSWPFYHPKIVKRT